MPILYAEGTLQAVVLRPSIISSGQHIGMSAVDEPAIGAGSEPRSSRSCTWRQACRNEAWESGLNKPIQGGIRICGLELGHSVGAVVAHLCGDVRANLALHPEGPLLRVRITQFGIYGREGARAKRWDGTRTGWNQPQVSVADIFTRAARGGQTTDTGERSSTLLYVRTRVYDRTRAGHVGEHVIERGIIGNTEAAANDGFILAEQALPNSRCPGKAHIGRPIIQPIRNMGHRRQALWQRWIPEWSCRVLFGHRKVVQQVDGLAVKFPANTEVQGQVVLDSPVILEVQGSILLLEGEVKGTIGQAEICCILQKSVEISKVERAVDRRQKTVGRTLPVILPAELEGMFCLGPDKVVLPLSNIDQAALRQIGCHAKEQ